MKIKIVQAGWEGFTGMFGVVEFVDGVSVNEISRSEAQALAATVSVVTLDGKDPSAAQQIIDLNDKPAEANVNLPTGDIESKPTETYTKEQLEEIADKDGIKGIRMIGDSLGVRGNSIADLIAKIMAVAGKKPEQEPVAEAAEPVAEAAVAEVAAVEEGKQPKKD